MRFSKTAQTKTTVKLTISLLSTLLFFYLSAITYAASAQAEKRAPYPIYPNIEVSSNMGKFYMRLDGNRSPITTKNFLDYITEEQFNDTIFHRVIPDFVAQGGGFDEKFNELPTRDAIVNESGNGLSNAKGTVAMARHFKPHSATAQFYINLVDNTKLDPRPDRWGYTVFGEIASGMYILEELAARPTGAGGDFEKDVPLKPFIVHSMRIMDADEQIPVLAPEPLIEESEDITPESEDESTADKMEDKAQAAKEKLIKEKLVKEK